MKRLCRFRKESVFDSPNSWCFSGTVTGPNRGSVAMLHEWRKHTASLLTLAVIQLVGLGLFAKGFFPYKVYLSGFADVSSIPPWLGDDVPAQTNLIEPEFDRLVLIVIDALRK